MLIKRLNFWGRQKQTTSVSPSLCCRPPSPIKRRLLPAANRICLARVSKHMEMSQMKPSLHFEPEPRRGLCELFRFFKTTTKGWRAPLKSHYCVAFSFLFSPPRACVCAREWLSRGEKVPSFWRRLRKCLISQSLPEARKKKKRKKTRGEETLVSLIVFNACKLRRVACVCIQKWLNQFLFLLKCAAETTRRLIICWNDWKNTSAISNF